jgi:hypothetical protein
MLRVPQRRSGSHGVVACYSYVTKAHLALLAHKRMKLCDDEHVFVDRKFAASLGVDPAKHRQIADRLCDLQLV